MAQEAAPWYKGLPEPKKTAEVVSRQRIFSLMHHIGDFLNGGPLLIDVRRTDYEGGKIRGSLNMPAQSFFMNMAVLYKLCRDADVERVIFYCGACSPTGRGPRCAGWFADYVAARSEEAQIPDQPDVFSLEGGIKGWVTSGTEYQQFVDGFEPEYWKQFAPEGKETVGSAEKSEESGGGLGDERTVKKRKESEA